LIYTEGELIELMISLSNIINKTLMIMLMEITPTQARKWYGQEDN